MNQDKFYHLQNAKRLCLHSETGNVQNECESYRRYSLQVMIIIDDKWFRLELMFKTIVKISGYFTKMRVFKTLKISQIDAAQALWKRKWIQLCSILKLSYPFLTKKYACQIFSQYTYDRGIPVAGLLVLLIPEIVQHPSVSLSACLSTSYVSVNICFSGHFVWERHCSSWLVCFPRVLVA